MKNYKHAWCLCVVSWSVLGILQASCKEISMSSRSEHPDTQDEGAGELDLALSQKATNQSVDPGVRTGTGAGTPLPGLTSDELEFFTAGTAEFVKTDSVSGSIPNTGKGLGPTFNSDSCISCHSQPAIGGSSPAVNPLIAIAGKEGAKNKIPAFITKDGPILEARFKYKTRPDGSLSRERDGGVYGLFTITGRSDAEGCSIAQPNFAAAERSNNLALRIPTPIFGGGMIEAITDQAILSSHQASAAARRKFGIEGRPSISGNDGTINRFGWKAQNKSLLMFAGEAYNVEMGASNELFPNKRGYAGAACITNTLPEDATHFDANDRIGTLSDVELFTVFMRMLAPPTPAPDNSAIIAGRAVFNEIGCNLCHTPSLPLGSYAITAVMAQKTANLYSDLLLHRMGSQLADDIVQGTAGPDEFRTAPLWGLGQRVFFLHDGRTKDLVEAIRMHASKQERRHHDHRDHRDHRGYQPSEANKVIDAFNRLSTKRGKDLLAFLRSL